MKRTIIFFSLLTICMLYGCKHEAQKVASEVLIAKEDEPMQLITANPVIDGKIAINLDKSTIFWRATMLFSFGEHYGNVNFKEGFVEFDNGKIIGGSFTVDMNSIINTDSDYSQDLIDHLKNEDFFEVNTYPESKLEFTSFEYVDTNRQKIDGNLTIKDITNIIELFNVEYVPNESKIRTKFKIDRTDFGINYNSKGFAKVKNYAISDAIELEVDVYF